MVHFKTIFEWTNQHPLFWGSLLLLLYYFRPGRFNYPHFVVIDKRDKNQLLITDHYNKAVRTVDMMSKAVGTFVKTDPIDYITGITQEEKSGDLYVTADNALYTITYIQRTLSPISGSTGSNPRGYRDSTLLNSLSLHIPTWPHLRCTSQAACG